MERTEDKTRKSAKSESEHQKRRSDEKQDMRAKKVPRYVVANDGWLELSPDVPVEGAA